MDGDRQTGRVREFNRQANDTRHFLKHCMIGDLREMLLFSAVVSLHFVVTDNFGNEQSMHGP